MDNKKIINKVKAKIIAKTAGIEEFLTKGVEVDKYYFFNLLLKKGLMDKLKSEWKIKEINVPDLDFFIKDVEIKWGAYFPRGSGVLNIQIKVPDQDVSFKGEVSYEDENENQYSYKFNQEVDLKDIEVSYGSIKLDSDIYPKEISCDKSLSKIKVDF